MLGAIPGDVIASHGDHLIADHARAPVGLCGVNPLSVHIALGGSDKEVARLMHVPQAGEIHMAPIRHVKGANLYRQDSKHVDVVHIAIADVDDGRNGAT